MQFIPPCLIEPFTVKEFGKEAHIPEKKASIVLNILYYMELVKRVGKKGNAYLYEILSY